MKHILFALALFCAAPALAVEVKEVKSEGGITAWLAEDHSLPLVTVKLAFRDAGTASDPAGREGRADLEAALLSEGAGKWDAQAFAQALEENAVRLRFDTSGDLFTASFSTLSDKKEPAFALLSAALLSPRFAPDAVERVRAQRLAALKGLEQDPDYALAHAFAQAAFPNHPYGQPGEGTPGSVKRLSAADFKTFKTRYLTRENLIVAVSGDITPEQLKPLMGAAFDALPARFAPEGIIPDIEVQGGKAHAERDIPQTLVKFGAQGIRRAEPDYLAAYVMNYLLGGGSMTARLGKALREEKGLTYGISTELSPMLHAALWEGEFATRRQEAENALALMRSTLARFAEEGVSEQELQDAKRYLTGSFVLNIDSNSNIADYLISMQLHRLGKDYLEKRNALINAVTREDVARTARRLLQPGGLIVATVGGKP